MLTWAELEQHVANKRLLKWLPGLKETPEEGRVLYVTPDVYEALSKRPWPGSAGEKRHHTKERRGAMRQVLERFCRGDSLLHTRDLKELSVEGRIAQMQGYWEIRSMGRMEETRLFGFFARPTAFVATSLNGRGMFRTQDDWNRRRQACAKIWLTLFPQGNWMDQPWPVTTKADMECYLNEPTV